MYREYGIQGRWPSPDPLGPGAFNLADPQSLNRYGYVLNNPTGSVDPLGLKILPGSFYHDLVGGYAALGGGVHLGATWNQFDLFQIPVVETGYQLALVNGHPGPSGIELPYSYTSNIGTGFINVPYSQVIGNAFELVGNSLGQSRSYPIGTALGPSPVRPSQAQLPIMRATPPPPPPASTRSVTASGLAGALISNFLGSDAQAGASLAVNIGAAIALGLVKKSAAALLPGPGWVYVGVAAIYDVAMVAKSYADCRYNGGPTPLP